MNNGKNRCDLKTENNKTTLLFVKIGLNLGC